LPTSRAEDGFRAVGDLILAYANYIDDVAPANTAKSYDVGNRGEYVSRYAADLIDDLVRQAAMGNRGEYASRYAADLIDDLVRQAAVGNRVRY
jgi:hypothetical protein